MNASVFGVKGQGHSMTKSTANGGIQSVHQVVISTSENCPFIYVKITSSKGKMCIVVVGIFILLWFAQV